MKAIFFLVMSLLLASAATAADVEGFWTGFAIRGGERRPISLHVERNDGDFSARYDIRSLSLEGMPLAKFVYDPATGVIGAGHAFKGRVSGDRITGELNPALLHGPPVKVELRRSSARLPSLAAHERAVEFTSRGHRLKGWLVSPRGRSRRPALASLHGSGPSTRWLALGRARRFAEAGYAMLIFDKPGTGESEGDWTMTSLDEMARDALAAVEFLRAQPEVDPDKVGLWGHSQAGWVISRAAAMPNSIAFAIVLAGGGASSRAIEDYGYAGRLDRAGASPEARAQAMAWVGDYFDYVRTGQGYDALTARLKANAGKEWVRSLGIDRVYPTPEQQPKWRWVATYDPAADIRRVRFPALLLFADRDESSPPQRSLAAWRNALRSGGNANVEWKMFANADHHFLTPARTDGWPSLAPGYYEVQFDWLRRIVQ